MSSCRPRSRKRERGLREGGIPIGSVLVHRGRILGRGHNRRVQQGSAIAARRDGRARERRPATGVGLPRSVIYTTLSPCAMCSGAILLYGIPQGVVGENQTFLGEEELLAVARRVGGGRCRIRAAFELMAEFIRAHPELWNEDIGS